MYSQTPGCVVAASATTSSPYPAVVVSPAEPRRFEPAAVSPSARLASRSTTAPNRVVLVEPQVIAPSARDMQWLAESDRYLVEKLLGEAFEYVDHPLFEEAGTEEELFGSRAVLSPGSTWFIESEESCPADTGGATVDAATERLLFQRYNYARRRVAETLRSHRRRKPSRAALQEMLAWLHRALMLRGRIAQANIALVLSMAKRSRFGGLDSSEVISAGNYALLRSIDRFDWSRGYKFSTYACQGIIQRILHVVDATRRYRSRFVSEYDETLEKDDSTVRRHEMQEAEWIEELRDILAGNRAGLSALERVVIQHRFGLGEASAAEEAKGKTLQEIGNIMGVTKERVRQIQKRALEKLRVVMERECMAA